MQSNFQRSVGLVLTTEGGYVNHPKDPGGPTNLGVTLGLAKQLGLDMDRDGDVDVVDIKLLKPADAAKVYKAFYWDAVAGDYLPAGVDYAVFDFAVNSGVRRASTFLQSIAGVAADGHIGPKTLAALSKLAPAQVVARLCADRLSYLNRLAGWPVFGAGWKRRVSDVGTVANRWANGG